MERTDAISLIVMPEMVLGTVVQAGDVADAALAHAEKLEDRFVILDVWDAEPGGVDGIGEVTTSFRSQITSQAARLRFGAAYYPYLDTSVPIAFEERRVTIRSHNGAGAHAIAGGTAITDRSVKEDRNDLYQAIVAKLDQTFVRIPPSGAVAGAFAATDHRQGVWKAPANVSLAGVTKPAVAIDPGFNDALNIDASSGKSVNAIRALKGKGTVIWGARTLDGNSNEYRYVPVRRLTMMVERSLSSGLAWMVFEPNDASTWSRAKLAAEDFLRGLFRDGAFAGMREKDAFFVRVGLGETMTANDVSNGRIVMEVGVAPLKPAEFIVLRIEKHTTV